MTHPMNQLEQFFFHEMMVHPALFAHPKPQKVAIIGKTDGILQEVLKHPTIQSIDCIDQLAAKTSDARVTFHSTLPTTGQDIIICNSSTLVANIDIFNLLTADGILVQPCQNPLIKPEQLKTAYQQLKQVGFNDWQILNFPQTTSPLDWLAIMLSTKGPLFKRIREKDIFNKQFSTNYYNYETHQAARALPEFARVVLES